MQMPEAQAEHHWLQKLVGEWAVETEAIMGPGLPPEKFSSTETATPVGDLWVVCEGTMDGPDGKPMRNIFTFGYDPALIHHPRRRRPPSFRPAHPRGATMTLVQSRSLDRPAVDVSLLIVRVAVGVIFAAHGSQKLFGAFGGPGIEKLVEMMGQQGLPPVVTWLVAIGEFFGGIGLVVGFLSRFSAASLIVIMIGAIALVHGQHGFFLGQDPKTAGFEYNLALIGLLAPILLCGPGQYAIGRLLPLPKSATTGRPVLVLE